MIEFVIFLKIAFQTIFHMFPGNLIASYLIL